MCRTKNRCLIWAGGTILGNHWRVEKVIAFNLGLEFKIDFSENEGVDDFENCYEFENNAFIFY